MNLTETGRRMTAVDATATIGGSVGRKLLGGFGGITPIASSGESERYGHSEKRRVLQVRGFSSRYSSLTKLPFAAFPLGDLRR
jgi:hypothetical protein